MMKMGAALWGSQSWLQPAFSRPSAEHEGSPTTHEPPERRLRARLPAPRLFSRKAHYRKPGTDTKFPAQFAGNVKGFFSFAAEEAGAKW
jgi:hypothetical protein